MPYKIPLEKTFKKKFLAQLLSEYSGACRITTNNPQETQGIPDVTINCLFDDGALYWKDLEFKRTRRSSRRPNQTHYVSKNGVFVSPQNSEEVLSEIRSQISEARRRARLLKPQ
jgi:hypothetical protein